MAAIRTLATALLPALIAASLLTTSDGLAQDKKEEPCLPGKPCSAASPAKAPSPRSAGVRRKAKLKKIEGPVATNLGFRMLPGGASEVFVLLNAKVQPQEIKTPGSVTYVLPGFHVPVHNNMHTLHTQYFKTPIADARLVQGKEDVRLVVLLRANAAPTLSVAEYDPGRAYELQVKFPAGDYQPETHEVLPPQHRPRRDPTTEPSKKTKGKKAQSKAPGPAAP